MANKKLSQAEIAKRMIRLRNLEKLHRLSKQCRTLQDKVIANLEELVSKQQELLEQQDKMLTTQAIRVAELEAMVFGKKRKPPTGTPAPTDLLADVPKLPRTKGSYRRPLPPASAITVTELVPVDHCQCGGKLGSLTTHERYVEDIPLPELTSGYSPQIVTK